MMEKFEALGSLIKVEDLRCLSENVLANTFVLESELPFPGYHHDIPTESVPRLVFLMTSEVYNREQVTRAAHNIKMYCPFGFDAAAGEIFINNDKLPCIRIKGLDSFENIAHLQSYFQNEDITFKKKKNLKGKGIIKVRKTFVLEEIKPDIYFDKLENTMAYFQIPKKLSWKLFEKITHNIKNNWDGQHFDAALAFFYKNFDIVEVARIYQESQDIETLEKLKEMYDTEIARY
ncbi:MAG: hypothetical protein U9R19_10130 [Bacteroidota bacterium]|nr:hypothetical protein [Bacteroidota bacterium]